jgi:hypothetical protein
MLLQASQLAGVTLQSVATSLGLQVAGVVRAEGDLDFRGTLGVDKAVPVGFTDIRLAFDLQATPPPRTSPPAPAHRGYCVVLQTLVAPPKLSATIDGAAPPAA